MNAYLLTLGWWNLIGCMMMFGFYNQEFGKKVFNEWTRIIRAEYVLDYWSRFWLFWVIGLNIFFALINILSVKWGYAEIQEFIVWFDIVVYLLFTGLTIWGIKTQRCGPGAYSALIVFGIWIIWGILSLYNYCF